MNINPSIFKAYDVRGLYPREINEEAVYSIGRAFVARLQKLAGHKRLTVLVGSDARASSPQLAKALEKGIAAQGGTIIDMGLASSPMFYFAVNKSKADGGVMITASHNPPQYNGLKFTSKNAKPIGSGSGLEEIRDSALEARFRPAARREKARKKTFLKEYLNFLLRETKKERFSGLHVAVDNGNGMAGLILPELFKKIKGIKIFPLYFEVDCEFPHHEANPLKEETLKDLKNLIKKRKADVGIAFDGDGDRVGFLTAHAVSVRADMITALLAKDYLKKHPGAIIAHDVRSSRAVRETILEYGGKPFVSRVGHSFFKRHLWEDGVEFGGELSGHYFFKEFFNADSGIFAMLRVLRILLEEKKPLAELIKPFEKYAASGEINFDVKDKVGTMKMLEKRFFGGAVSKVDGLSVEYKDWWFNVRPSNTEPLLRLNVEATARRLLSKKLKELTILIRKRQK